MTYIRHFPNPFLSLFYIVVRQSWLKFLGIPLQILRRATLLLWMYKISISDRYMSYLLKWKKKVKDSKSRFTEITTLRNSNVEGHTFSSTRIRNDYLVRNAFLENRQTSDLDERWRDRLMRTNKETKRDMDLQNIGENRGTRLQLFLQYGREC